MLTRKQTAKKNGIRKSTLVIFIANKEKIIEAHQKHNFNRDRKWIWTSAHLNDEAVLDQQNVVEVSLQAVL